MKKTIGTIRDYDKQGRICVPAQMRRALKSNKVQLVLVEESNGEYIIEIRKAS